MHEINAAAETITAAADSDANIIFGATINPDLEGEVIITVVATGFDASYFKERVASTIEPAALTPAESKVEDTMMKDIDLDLSVTRDEADSFTSDSPMPNIWSIDTNHDEEEHSRSQQPKLEPIVSSNFDQDGDELEKPSFLRRLKKLRGQSDSEDKKDDSTEDNTSK